MKITINQNENQTIGISNKNIQDISINESEKQLISLKSNSPQSLGINQNENQVILINGNGEIIGITDVLVNGVSVVSNNIAYILVPTKTSELINNSGFLTSETDPTVPNYIKQISLSDINNWNNKQNALVSGTNIKTINNESLLGSGNININSGESYSAGTGIDITNNVISNTITNYNDLTGLPTIPNKTSDLINDSDFVSEDDLSEVAFTGSYNSLSDTPVIPDSTSDLTNDSGFIDSTDLSTALSTKQDTLVSGTNIKTINNTSLLGSGNIAISSGNTYTAGTGININSSNVISNTITDYNDLTGLPTIPTKTSELTNDSGYITNNYQIFSTTETRIGTWINNKPLYRKVVHLGSLPAGAYYNLIPSGITNMGVMVALYGGAMSGSNNGFPLPYLGATSSGGNIELVYLSNGDIRVWCTKDYSALDGYVVIEYTKSTD